MAAELGRPLVTVACNDETSAADLLGRWLVRGAETVWQDGPVTRAVRAGAILYLDEVAEAREDVIVVIHPLSDHRRQLFIDRRDEAVAAPDPFMLVVSFNPGYRRGLKELKPSTRQRFVALPSTTPRPTSRPRSSARRRASTRASRASSSPSRARCARWTSPASRRPPPRASSSAPRDSCVSGLAPRVACGAAVVQPLTDDPTTARALQDLADLTF
jgi:nitric oxide reductase NorQ protein